MAIMLGGWASRNKYAIISAARIVSQNVAYEIPMLLVVITLLMVTGTANLRRDRRAASRRVLEMEYSSSSAVNPLMPVTFIIFFICMLAETNRAPFDMAEAESELVAGAFTEYAGMGFGVFFMAEYANILVGCSLATILFFGGWQSPIGVLVRGCCLVPAEALLADLHRHLGAMDISAHAILQSAQSLLENSDPDSRWSPSCSPARC